MHDHFMIGVPFARTMNPRNRPGAVIFTNSARLLFS
jgi:hypothetical protein